MKSVQQMFYNASEGINISKNREWISSLEEAVKKIALPIIETLGQFARNVMDEGVKAGAIVAEFMQGSPVSGVAIFLVALTGAASFAVYKMAMRESTSPVVESEELTPPPVEIKEEGQDVSSPVLNEISAETREEKEVGQFDALLGSVSDLGKKIVKLQSDVLDSVNDLGEKIEKWQPLSSFSLVESSEEMEDALNRGDIY